MVEPENDDDNANPPRLEQEQEGSNNNNNDHNGIQNDSNDAAIQNNDNNNNNAANHETPATPPPQQQEQQEPNPPPAPTRRRRTPGPPPPPPPRATISLTKLILVGVLAGFCLFLQVTVWTLEALLEERQALVNNGSSSHHKMKRKTTTTASSSSSSSSTSSGAGNPDDDPHNNNSHRYGRDKTFKPVDLTSELHLQQSVDMASTGQSPLTQRNALWRQAVELWLASWDPNVAAATGAAPPRTTTTTASDKKNKNYRIVSPLSVSSSSSSSTSSSSSSSATAGTGAVYSLLEEWQQNATLAWVALEQAAQLGHPYAQFHVANALASGIYLGDAVQDTWTVPDSPQQQKAWLYWHMASIGGNVEAALALAFRLAEQQKQEQQQIQLQGKDSATLSMSSSNSMTTTACWQQLPYFREAALGIVDALELDPQSRAKVAPATDKHVLYQIHLHGGTPSKLEFHNKADESPDALQFYHLRAMSGSSSSTSGGGSSSKKGDSDQAATAAYTLANFYHYGVRGVAQNLTLAASYYERAALLNHWESAGVLGHLYLWGTGVPQDLYKAHKFFTIGMPLSLAACQRRFQLKLKRKHGGGGKEDDDEDDDDDDDELVHLCDTECINGMGLLKVFGLPHVMTVDMDQAEDMFVLARDQGSADAAYNLAMLKLGWSQHWKPLNDENDNDKSKSEPSKSSGESDNDSKQQQQTMIKDQIFPKLEGRYHPTVPEYQAALADFTFAAGKGHIQARLRLGLLYAEGMKVPNDGPNNSNNNNNKATVMLSSLFSSSASSKAGSNANAAAGAAAAGGGGTSEVVAIPKDCSKALKQFRWISETVCPYRTKRLRKAYKQYIAGDTQASLLNYLAAAETGSTVGLLNAAFLLEKGECLSKSAAPIGSSSHGVSTSFWSSSASPFFYSPSSLSSSSSSSTVLLSSVECAKASARLWKAAANKGHGEASLRVGDFYYYRRFREPSEQEKQQMTHRVMDVGPFGWVQYLIFPEHGIPILWNSLIQSFTKLYQTIFVSTTTRTTESEDGGNVEMAGPGDEASEDGEHVCRVDDENNPQQCSAPSESEAANGDGSRTKKTKKDAMVDAALESDLEMAAHYYRLATETVDNARAHFNLGFLYEWGLGLKQDFPLAKRHYDLAISSSSGGSNEAELPVAIALWAMSIHEKCLKLYRSTNQWWEDYQQSAAASQEQNQLFVQLLLGGGNDDPEKRQKILEILKKHLWNVESLAIVALTIVFVYLMRLRNFRY